MTTTDTIATTLVDTLRGIAAAGIDEDTLQSLIAEAQAAIGLIAQAARNAAGANTLDGAMGGAIGVVLACQAAEAAITACMRELGRTNSGVAEAYDGARNALQAALAECGDPGAHRAETPFHVAYLTIGRASVEITDEAKIPSLFWREKLEPNKQALLPLLRAGQSIPGTALRMSPASLTIRAKEATS